MTLRDIINNGKRLTIYGKDIDSEEIYALIQDNNNNIIAIRTGYTDFYIIKSFEIFPEVELSGRINSYDDTSKYSEYCSGIFNEYDKNHVRVFNIKPDDLRNALEEDFARCQMTEDDLDIELNNDLIINIEMLEAIQKGMNAQRIVEFIK